MNGAQKFAPTGGRHSIPLAPPLISSPKSCNDEQACGDDTVTLKTLYTWFKKFIDDRESVEDVHWSGRPTTADNARRYNTTLVKRFLPQHGVTELLHPSPYSPDLSL
ncbi:hypothetical protein AVEN_229882-1 [Araneus ventricosus]|uniref:Mos1 transposase HTH domain-containing protein n=1 Tax=Araneus ventricosus TaxID=182803 RepID=A0A4Y2UJ15_ARAVE|nr:hypothetical protein AVEN_229882-1 [Araneus ventricosus]